MNAELMHSAAPARPRGIASEQRAHARHLRVAEIARRRRRARWLVWLVALASGLAVFVLVAFHVFAVQQAFAIDRLTNEQQQEQLRYERLRVEVATLSSPPAILATATRMGMQPPQSVVYLQAPAAAPRGNAPDRTSSTLAETQGEAKQHGGP
jgi:cell division protein FtsL